MKIILFPWEKRPVCRWARAKRNSRLFLLFISPKRGDKSGDYYSIYIRTSSVRIILDNTQSFSYLRSVYPVVSSENGVQLLLNIFHDLHGWIMVERTIRPKLDSGHRFFLLFCFVLVCLFVCFSGRRRYFEDARATCSSRALCKS